MGKGWCLHDWASRAAIAFPNRVLSGRAVGDAGRHPGLTKRASCHTLRHSFASHLLDESYVIRTIQELLGHKDVRTTMIRTHVLNRSEHGVRSPLDDR